MAPCALSPESSVRSTERTTSSFARMRMTPNEYQIREYKRWHALPESQADVFGLLDIDGILVHPNVIEISNSASAQLTA